MVQASAASQFWSAVQDCLITFHRFDRDKAAEKVTSAWRQLPLRTEAKDNQTSFDDMIYHAEPWYIACNLAGVNLPIGGYQLAYNNLLGRNNLADEFDVPHNLEEFRR